MPYHRCDRCWRKVSGVECVLLVGERYNQCKQCRTQWAGRFTTDELTDEINRARAAMHSQARDDGIRRRRDAFFQLNNIEL